MVYLYRIRSALSALKCDCLAGIGIIQDACRDMMIIGICDILQVTAQNIVSGSRITAKSLAVKPCTE